MIDLELAVPSSIFTRKFNVSIANVAEVAIPYINGSPGTQAGVGNGLASSISTTQ